MDVIRLKNHHMDVCWCCCNVFEFVCQSDKRRCCGKWAHLLKGDNTVWWQMVQDDKVWDLGGYNRPILRHAYVVLSCLVIHWFIRDRTPSPTNLVQSITDSGSMTPLQELEVAYAERVEREVAMQTESGHRVSLLLWSMMMVNVSGCSAFSAKWGPRSWSCTQGSQFDSILTLDDRIFIPCWNRSKNIYYIY